MLTETWLDEGQNPEDYQLPYYNANFNSSGRGKGIASYYNEKLIHKANVTEEGFSISVLETKDIDVIGVYRSQDGNTNFLIEKLEDIIDETKMTIIGGDLNVCVMSSPNNNITKKMRSKGFTQLVNKATHIEGGLIDHVYVKTNVDCQYSWSIEDFPKYYSDHDSIGLTLWKLGQADQKKNKSNLKDLEMQEDQDLESK